MNILSPRSISLDGTFEVRKKCYYQPNKFFSKKSIWVKKKQFYADFKFVDASKKKIVNFKYFRFCKFLHGFQERFLKPLSTNFEIGMTFCGFGNYIDFLQKNNLIRSY
jgi:hypothetical protein